MVRDEDGVPLREGDYITFSFGIPPISVLARLSESKGEIWLTCLSPDDVTPKREKLSTLMKYYQVWKASQARVASVNRAMPHHTGDTP